MEDTTPSKSASASALQEDGLRKELSRQLKAEARISKRLATGNYVAAYILSIIIVAASIAATILAATDAGAKITAIIASIPALVVAINTTFKFERKSDWHYKRLKKIKSFVQNLDFENVDVAFVSSEFSKFEHEMDPQFVSFNGASTTTTKTDP